VILYIAQLASFKKKKKKKEPTSKRVLRTVTAWERGFDRVSQKIDFFFLLKINQS
jgi:hypothetical protein